MKTIKKFILFFFIEILLISLSNSFAISQTKTNGKEWKVPDSEAKKKNPIQIDAAAIKKGKEIWGKYCKSCHGVKGGGDGPKAEALNISYDEQFIVEMQKLSDGTLYWETTVGKMPMPSYKEKLSDSERWQVVAFIKTLKQSADTMNSANTISVSRLNYYRRHGDTASYSTTSPFIKNNTETSNNKTDDSNLSKSDTVISNVVKENGNIKNLNESDTTNISYYQYQQLQIEVKQLKKEIVELKAKNNQSKKLKK